MVNCKLCKNQPGDTDGLCTLCRSLHHLVREVSQLPPVLRGWALDHTRQWSGIVAEELYKFKGANPKPSTPGATPKSVGAVHQYFEAPRSGSKEGSVKKEPQRSEERERRSDEASPVRAASSRVSRRRRERESRSERRSRSRSFRRRGGRERRSHSLDRGVSEERGKERKRARSSRRKESRGEERRVDERRPAEPSKGPPRKGRGKGSKGHHHEWKKWTNKGRTKAKAKAAVKAKAKARGGAPRRGLLRIRRPALRRPAHRGEESGEEDPPRGEERRGEFEDGSWVEANSLALGHLSEGAEVVAEGSYWSASCKVCGKIRGLHILGDKSTEVVLEASGTDHEELLKWVSGQTGKKLRLHLCGTACANKVDANGLVHVVRIRKKTPEDRGGWAENLVVELDELALLREEAHRRGEEAPAPKESGKEPEKTKKKRKEKKRSSSSGGKKDKKGKKSKKGQRPEAQKSLELCFGKTGLDPSPKMRRKIRSYAARKMKKKKESSSDSSGSSKSCKSLEEGSQDEESGQSEDLFTDPHRVRRWASKGPGLLAAQTVREMQRQLLTNTGQVWEQESGKGGVNSLLVHRSPAAREISKLLRCTGAAAEKPRVGGEWGVVGSGPKNRNMPTRQSHLEHPHRDYASFQGEPAGEEGSAVGQGQKSRTRRRRRFIVLEGKLKVRRERKGLQRKGKEGRKRGCKEVRKVGSDKALLDQGEEANSKKRQKIEESLLDPGGTKDEAAKIQRQSKGPQFSKEGVIVEETPEAREEFRRDGKVFHVKPQRVSKTTAGTGKASPSSVGIADCPLAAGPSDSSDGAEKKSEASVQLESLVGSSFMACAPIVESLLISNQRLCKLHSTAKTTGDVFPLPTSSDSLGDVCQTNGVDLPMMRVLVMGLNSYAGAAVSCDKPLTRLQTRFLKNLCEDLRNVQSWPEKFGSLSWKEFFKFRGVDYAGDEVATAQSTTWSNLKSAIPNEVGSVPLEAVCEGGCREYVHSFEKYLLDEPNRVYTKPPRVMVPDHAWEETCKGLVSSGLCGLIPESQVIHVDGKPLLNGLFGVSKGEVADGHEVHRLIMNLIPLNNICRGMDGDVATLPSWSSTSPLCLLPEEQLVVSSEDVRCFFYIFAVPPSWHRYLGFNKRVPSELHPGSDEPHVLCAKVLPMGFKNSVSLAQHVRRAIVQRASLRVTDQLQPHQELRKDKMFTSASAIHRVYLDNFDQMEKVDAKLASTISGSPCPAVLALRAEYEEWGIPRHPKKAMERGQRVEVQGAIVDGVAGTAAPKPEKILKYVQLALLLAQSSRCSQRQAQVVAGGLVYVATFRRSLMGSLNAIWAFIEEFNAHPPVIHLEVPAMVKLELVRFIALIPLARMNFRNQPSPVVTASDASTTGGGVTVSRGLTNVGQVAALCPIRGDLPDEQASCGVLTIGLFDGIGAVRVAADAAGLPVIGHISVEIHEAASRVLESRFPSTTFVKNVEDIDQEMVTTWACRYSQASVVVIGAGPPCQGVSGLNVDRKGALRDRRSGLYVHVPRVRELVRKAFPWAQVHYLSESVASMDEADREVMSDSFGDQAWLIDAMGVSLARRPRLYWCSWEVVATPSSTIAPAVSTNLKDFGTIVLQAQLDPSRYLCPGWQLNSEEKLPTFTTSRPRDRPGRRPAGLDRLSAWERSVWEDDSFRFPPYQYQWIYQVSKGSSTRMVNINEREAIMGFPRDYTIQCLPKAEHGSVKHNDIRLSLIGNSWNVTVVTWLLSQLGARLGLSLPLSPQQCVDRAMPGASQDLPTFLSRPLLSAPKKKLCSGNEVTLVRKLMNMVSIKGEDILLSAGSEETLRYHRLRASLPSNLWQRRTVCGWRWQGHKEHINVLELRAVLCALRWRILKQGSCNMRLVHLTDSLVCLHTLTRGRTSSKKLRRTLARINALLLLSNNVGALLDPLISDYIEHLWANGEGRSLASDSIAALQDKDPSIKGHLASSWRLLKTWNAHEIPNRAPPMTEQALHTLVGHALFNDRAPFALSLLLGFYGLLRTGELLGLKNQDISQASPTSVAVISLGLTKGGKRMGASESVTITEEDTLRRLWQWKVTHSKGDSLCPSPSVWRRLFNLTVAALDLDSYQYRPYSLRRGGATFYFKKHGQLDRLLVQGRWQSTRTARIYLNDGLAILAENQLSLAPHARVFLSQSRWTSPPAQQWL
eukprot:Skav231607  [mRNA]  locus=scaffold1636:8556:16397:- [translate_table: standard]